MKSINLKLTRFLRYFNRIESMLSETLAIVLFGAAADVEYEDIPLPSERKKDEGLSVSSKDQSKKKKSFRGFRLGGQLKLFMSRTSKKLLLKLLLSVEKLVLNLSRKSSNISYENSYK
jgi:hypothetical protein